MTENEQFYTIKPGKSRAMIDINLKQVLQIIDILHLKKYSAIILLLNRFNCTMARKLINT